MAHIDVTWACSTPRWSWCDRCNLTTYATWDLLSISLDGVKIHQTVGGCVREYEDRKRARNGG